MMWRENDMVAALSVAVVLGTVLAPAAPAGAGQRHAQDLIAVSSGTSVIYGRIIAVEEGGRMVVVRRRTRDYFIVLSSDTVVTRGSECLSTGDLLPGQAVIVRYMNCADQNMAVRVHLEPIVVLPPARR